MAFKVGDTVQLKSGGLAMTVSEVGDDGVTCEWMSRREKIESHTFDPEMLTEAQADTGAAWLKALKAAEEQGRDQGVK